MATKQQTLTNEQIDEHEGEEQCPDCSQWYEIVAQHWSMGSCNRPSFTGEQREVLIGSLLGDGSYSIRDNVFRWKNVITKPYLHWLENKFGILCNDVREGESIERSRGGLAELGGCNVDHYNLSHKFTLQTKPHPELKFCKEWGYSEDGFKSHFPEIELTPTILRTWYVGDGGLSWGSDGFKRVRISNSDQIHRVDYLKSLFNGIGFDVGVSSNAIRIPKSQTEAFFSYIGDPPTGREDAYLYKWQWHDREEYDRLYKKMKAQNYLGEDYE